MFLPYKNSSSVMLSIDNLELPIAATEDGIYVFDSSGKRYLDASSGAGVSGVGHNNIEVTNTIIRQLNKLSYVHRRFFRNEATEDLARYLMGLLPSDDFGYAYFVSSGSEANEAALKLANQYFIERGEKERKYFIARKRGYHGCTIGALSVTGDVNRREPFQNMMGNNFTFISPCYAYRYQKDMETEEEYGLRSANELEQTILKIGEKNIAAFICETVVGSMLGAVCAAKGYFKRIREICDKYGILLILDEVMCGCGRTGARFAFEHEKIIPDIITLAKGLGGGYVPIGAMLASKKIYDTVRGGSGEFRHVSSFANHPLAATAALAVQSYISNNNLVANAQKVGGELLLRLKNSLSGHQFVGDVRGRGLLLGIEIVQDKATKKPFATDLKLAYKIKTNGQENGILCYPIDGTIDGTSGTHILLAPPLILEEKHLNEIVDKICVTLERVFYKI